MTPESSTSAKVRQAANAIKKRIVWIAAVVVIISSLTMMLSLLSPTVYKTSFLVESKVLSETQTDLLVENINDILTNEKSVGSNLIDPKLVNMVDRISLSPVKTDEKSSFKIHLFYFDREMTGELVQAVVKYINKNEFVAEKVDNTRKMKTQLLDEIAQRTQKMELELNGGAQATQQTDKLNLYAYERNQEYVTLKDKQFELERELKELQGYYIIEPALVPTNPFGPNVLMNTLLAIIFSSLVAVSVVVIIES